MASSSPTSVRGLQPSARFGRNSGFQPRLLVRRRHSGPRHTPARRDRMTFYVTGPQLTKADTARITLRRTEVDDFAWADRHRAKDVLPTLAAL